MKAGGNVSEGSAMTLNQLTRAVSKEAAAFRRNTKKLTPSQIYNKACDVYTVEQIVYMICESREYYKDDIHIRHVMSKLCVEGKFLSEFLDWSSSANEVDVSNVDRALDTLSDFCLHCEKNGKV
jgi:hypothetical protein